MNQEALFLRFREYTRPIHVIPPKFLHLMRELLHHYFKAFLIGVEPYTIDKAIQSMPPDTSPGWPYYYFYNNKAESVFSEWSHISNCIDFYFNERNVCFPHAMTLKDELLSKAKVDAMRTRLFNIVSAPTVIVQSMCFKAQNESMSLNLASHPMAIGVDMPGPGFCGLFFQLRARNRNREGIKCFGDDDVSGMDLGFNPGAAATCCAFRQEFLPLEYRKAAYNTYAECYDGFVIVLGHILKIRPFNPSGQLNTGEDNSFYKLLFYLMAFVHQNPHLCQNFSEIVSNFTTYIFPRVGGDDGAWVNANIEKCNFHPKVMMEYLANYGMFLELTDIDYKQPNDLVFFSNKLIPRWFAPLNAVIWCSGGRKNKYIAALQWGHTKDEAMTVARLYGIVNLLFPWPEDYEYYLRIVDNWVARHPRNQANDVAWLNAKKMRLTEWELMSIHTGIGR